MPRPSIVQPYRWIAEYYDELFSPFRSQMNTARERLLRRVMPDVKSACDLACGTGTTALMLARRGIRMYAVDLSPKMCQLSREKAEKSNTALRVIRGDMRTFRLPEAVDLITCEFDALNHIPRRADLRLVARSVERALRPGGHFFFDVNNSIGFEKYWSGNVWFEKPNVVMVMRNGHNPKADKAWSDIEWFIREGSCWRRRHERVEEVCWSFDEVRRVFEKAGFDQVRAWDATPFFKGDPLITAGCRSFYVARKAERQARSHT